MIALLTIIALICAVISIDLHYKVKRTNYIQRKETDQIRAFRSKQK